MMAKLEVIKTAGNAFFTSEKFPEAISKYEKILRYLDVLVVEVEEQGKRVKALELTCHSNAAACYLKLKKNFEAIKACDKVT